MVTDDAVANWKRSKAAAAVGRGLRAPEGWLGRTFFFTRHHHHFLRVAHKSLLPLLRPRSNFPKRLVGLFGRIFQYLREKRSGNFFKEELVRARKEKDEHQFLI